ncbi:MAG: hypothetical protein RSC34_03735 [Alistipes sp.]
MEVDDLRSEVEVLRGELAELELRLEEVLELSVRGQEVSLEIRDDGAPSSEGGGEGLGGQEIVQEGGLAYWVQYVGRWSFDAVANVWRFARSNAVPAVKVALVTHAKDHTNGVV